MKQIKFTIALIMLNMISINCFAYDIAVKNEDGVYIYYNYINDNKELEVTYHSNLDYRGNIVIPTEATYAGRTRKVTSIGKNAFSEDTSLTSVTIPNSVTSIGKEAFYGCSGLKKVIVKDIAAWCNINFNSLFANPLGYAHHLFSDENTEITNLVIPNSVTSIGGYAFESCSGLTSVTIPNSVTSIGQKAFKDCSGLTSVTIGNNVKSIGNYAFQECFGLTSVTIGNSVTSIGQKAFYGCSGLTSVTIPNSVTTIGDNAFGGCTALTSVTIPNSVTSIGSEAFKDCSSLTSVTIGNSVTSIAGYAFYGCSSLTSVTIGNSVTSIGREAFHCSSLKKVIVKDIAAWCNISFDIDIDFDIYYANPLQYAHHLYSDENTEITNLIIPNSVTSIAGYAFYGCSGLTSVTIPNSVTSIGAAAFRSCSGLTSIIIPNSVTSMGEYAFSFIPKNLLEISCYIEEPTKATGSSFSDAIYKNATLYIPKGTMSKYKSTDGWKNFVFIEEGIPSGINSVSIDATEEERFNLRGEKLSTPQRGVNIIRMSDGTTKKVVVK